MTQENKDDYNDPKKRSSNFRNRSTYKEKIFLTFYEHNKKLETETVKVVKKAAIGTWENQMRNIYT